MDNESAEKLRLVAEINNVVKGEICDYIRNRGYFGRIPEVKERSNHDIESYLVNEAMVIVNKCLQGGLTIEQTLDEVDLKMEELTLSCP